MIYYLLRLIILDDRQLDGEGRTLAELAVHLYLTVVQVDDLLDVSQSETEALHVVHITRMHPIEFLEDLLQVFLLHAQAVVAHREVEPLVVVPRLQRHIERLVGLMVFDCIIHQIEDDILEVDLVNVNGGVDRLNVYENLATRMLNAQRERVGYRLHHLVEVEALLLE